VSEACETKAYYTIPNIAPTSSGSIHVVPRQVLERIVQGDIQIIMNNESLQPVLSTIVSEWMRYVETMDRLADEKLKNDVAARFSGSYDEWSSQEFAKEVIETFVEEVYSKGPSDG